MAEATSPTITTGSSQLDSPPFEIPRTSPVSPATKVDRAEQVEAALGVGLGQLAKDEPAPERRRASPSGTLNQKTQCHEIADQGAAEHRPDHQPDRGDHRVGPHGEPELLAGEGVGDQRGGVREQEGAADALDDPPQDQLGPVRGEAGAERGEREDEKAADVGRLRPKRSERRPAVSTSTVEAIM